MELIDQRMKKIMEDCKKKAKDVGLQISGETLEYIVTNQDLLELSPKHMIPTLYDYWVHDVNVVRDKWIYDIYPNNPYEVVINTRPAISFYNDNNPDWLNAMLFLHVLGHIDFFQNNIFFRNTWNDDFCGQALADKRLLNSIREELGAEKRWVDYVIEFAKSIDNLVGYYDELKEIEQTQMQSVFGKFSEKINFYFGKFLKQHYEQKTIELEFYHKEIERYNHCLKEFGPKRGEAAFFDEDNFKNKFPEFNSVFKKHKKKEKPKIKDILQHIMEDSEFINREKNEWMKDVIQVVRRTSLFFQSMFRTQTCNEGWASLWHERLFIPDENIRGHEVGFAKLNSGILINPKIGFNPYSIGKQLFEFIEEMASKGKLSYGFQMIRDSEERKHYDQKLGEAFGKKILFECRKNFNDSMLINFLSNNDFQDFMNRHDLFLAGARLNPEKIGFAEVYIKSRKAEDYRKMINKSLYHPPHIVINKEEAEANELDLNHIFEDRTLVTKYIPAVLRALSFFMGGNRVTLETTEFEKDANYWERLGNMEDDVKYEKSRVFYSCKGKEVKKDILFQYNGEEE